MTRRGHSLKRSTRAALLLTGALAAALLAGCSSAPRKAASVAVPVKASPGQEVSVSLYADKGARGTFDFDPASKKESPDRPYFVDGRQVTITVRLQ